MKKKTEDTGKPAIFPPDFTKKRGTVKLEIYDNGVGMGLVNEDPEKPLTYMETVGAFHVALGSLMRDQAETSKKMHRQYLTSLKKKKGK
jgi:hypothetical protein